MKWLKRKLLNWLMKDLFCALTEEEVFKIVTKKISQTEITKTLMVGEDEVPEKYLQEYVGGAQDLQTSYVWEKINEQVKLAANQRMFDKSVTAEDMIFGKAMLYNLDLLNKYIDLLAKLKL